MTADQIHTREQHLQQLESFCQALAGSFAHVGMAPEQSEEMWRLAVSAECTQCGIRIFGEELHALSQPPSAQHPNAKLGRLRLGCCARDGCNSYFYRLTFYPYGNLDWPTLLASLDATKDNWAKQGAGESEGTSGWGLIWQSAAARRVALGLVLVVLLLVIRQWYIGGRIPLLREPQQFQAAPESMGSATN